MKTRTTSSSLIALLLACLGVLPKAQAVVPAPDGGYPGGNTAEGQNALLSLNVNTGTNNTAVGWFSLKSNVEGQFNTAVGAGTLFNNTASRNTAIGGAAMFSNTSGSFNTAVGMLSLFTNSTGSNNTAIGDGALQNNTTGDGSTATGARALRNNTTGDFNTALGRGAGESITGSGNVCIGSGVFGEVGVNFSTYIGNVYDSVATARAVYVNSNNKIATLSSSRRYKEEIRPMAEASEAILALRPMTFRYKKDIEPTRSRSFGLIAEEVAKVSSDQITRDEQGNPQTVRYEAVNAMLLNEFQKEHRKNEEQEAIINRQQKQIEALATGLQKVSAQLEASKPASQVVLNDQ